MSYSPTVLLAVLVLVTSGPAEAAKLSKRDRAAVESGNATHQQKANYVGNLMTDEVRRYALLQAWAVHPADFPIETYTSQISADRVPAMFRGTDAGTMLVENGAVSICLMEDPCASHLAEIAVQMNQLPKETLVAAYRQKSQIDAELFREQIGSNIQTAIAASSAPAPEPTRETSPPAQAGQVLDFLLDPYSNETITRVVASDGNQQVIKEENGVDVVIADLASTGDKFLVTTLDGKRFQANQVKLTYFGFLMISDSELYSYDGENYQRLYFPDGFGVAEVQRNDVYETGAILLERKDDGSDQRLGFRSLGRALGVDSLGRTLGLNKKLDYALLNLRNGRTEFFNVDLAGKNVHLMSNCVPKKGGLFNECSRMDTQEGLYKQDGFVNYNHYLWAIDWARTPEGLYAVVQEHTKITVTDLTTGERKVAFERGLGINGFDLDKGADGNLALSARLGLRTGTIANVVDEFINLAAYEETANQ